MEVVNLSVCLFKRRRAGCMDLTVVEVASRCPFCSGALEIVEDKSYIWFGCRRCMRYVRREKRELTRRYVDYTSRRFDWRGLVSELYAVYLNRG
jgi:hypothetical protein